MPGPARLRAILPKQQINAEYTPPKIKRWFKKVGEEFRKEMKFYPPPVPGQSYVRTGTYRSGWDSPLIIGPASVQLLNEVAYARYVGGPNVRRTTRVGQRKLFAQRGWPSTTDVVPRVIKKYRVELDKVILPFKTPGSGV